MEDEIDIEISELLESVDIYGDSICSDSLPFLLGLAIQVVWCWLESVGLALAVVVVVVVI